MLQRNRPTVFHDQHSELRKRLGIVIEGYSCTMVRGQ